MEKLKLKALQLGAKELLTKEQMKKITGGTGCPPNLCTANGGGGNCGRQSAGATCTCVVGGQYLYSAFCNAE